MTRTDHPTITPSSVTARRGSPGAPLYSPHGKSASRAKVFRRTLALGIALVAISGCGGGSGPLGIQPPTAAQILAKPSKAGIRDMHMKIGTQGANGVPLSGAGTLELSPKQASQFVVTAPLGALGTVSVEYIALDGTQYTRVGSGKYSASKDTGSTSQSGNWSQGKDPKLIDEPTINGEKVWHMRATDAAGNAFELWVREKDGFPLKYVGGVASALTMEFSDFNKGTAISAPPADQVKPEAKTGAGTVGQPVKLNYATITVTQVDKNYKTGNAYVTPKAGNTFVAVEVLYEATGTDKVSYGSYDWKIKDESGAEYQTTYGAKNPQLQSGDLNPGEKARGWMVFEIPAAASGLKLNSKVGEDSISVSL